MSIMEEVLADLPKLCLLNLFTKTITKTVFLRNENIENKRTLVHPMLSTYCCNTT